MTIDITAAVDSLNQHFLSNYPKDAARRIESLPADEILPTLAQQPARVLAAMWEYLAPGISEALLRGLPDPVAIAVLNEMDIARAAAVLGRLDEDARERLLSRLDVRLAKDMRDLIHFPADSAGHLMDTRVAGFRDDTMIGAAIERLRAAGSRAIRHLLLLDEDNRLTGQVPIEALVFGGADEPLGDHARPVAAAVSPLDPHSDVTDKLNRYKLDELPVLDSDGRFLGAIRYERLISTLQEEATADIQTMVGASKDERALSPSLFAVRRRLPWLQINLLTAFLAAAVVGVFEDTIARITALAVLLPVVAGQSGNAGAQALAVTMRGLALREVTVRHWLRVMTKETIVGLLNGIGVAITCAIGVFVWSQSYGLVLVISVSMVLSMVAAGIAGALVPMVLQRLGQDPATASSIVLTTVTDIAGFMSFLGIATILQGMLVAE